MKLTKHMRINIERLIWHFVALAFISLGIFSNEMKYLIPIGTFMIGIILGQLK